MIDLYRFYDSQGRLLYIGISTHAAIRAASHRAEKPWWRDVARMDVEHLEVDRRTAELIEANAIRDEMPRWNVTHNHKSQIGTPWGWIYDSGDLTTRPVDLMERISLFVEEHGGQPVRDIVWAMGGDTAHVCRAVGLLMIEGYLDVYKKQHEDAPRFLCLVEFRAATDEGVNRSWWQDDMRAEMAREALC